jgi:hypothetical protein
MQGIKHKCVGGRAISILVTFDLNKIEKIYDFDPALGMTDFLGRPFNWDMTVHINYYTTSL